MLSNTGAYGNHAGPVLFHAVGECIGVYNCPNKKVDAIAAYTNTVPAGAFRGYGLPQTLIAVEAAIDELAKQLGISPFDMRRRNVVKPGDPMLSPPDVRLSRRALRLLRARPVPRPGRARDGDRGAPRPTLRRTG